MNGTVTGEQVVAATRKYLNVPFKLHGRDKTGIDCIGLVSCVAREFGLVFDDIIDYDMETGIPVETIKRLLHRFAQTSAENIMPGDLWTFKNLLTGTCTGCSIISGITVGTFGGSGSFGRMSRIIQCETTSSSNGPPRWRVVEDTMGIFDVLALTSRGLSASAVLRASLFYRFPFVTG